ncbi:MAG TPA: TRAP transporter substrate-binding protein [Burkholderiaceae bacterium]|jgi:C4-dicarboxylate-binding protein DctP|nr:TRAP transporter substrate-binding protein [Burkholderiaceae bacterium]
MNLQFRPQGFAALALLGGLALIAVPQARSQQPIVIKFSHVVAADTPKGQGAERFKQLAEQLTKGRVKVEVYPNSTLYKDKEELEALQLGSVQMLAPSLAKFGPLGVKEFEVFDIPYMFPSEAFLARVESGPIGRKLMSKLETKGITGLAFWDNGFKVFSANRSIVSPGDLKGLKMRIQSSKVLEAQMRALDAIPQVMAFGDVYQALQTGVVDGTENPWSNMYTQKMHEVQKYAVDTYHGYLGYAVIVNTRFWSGLPPDIRSALESAMKDATQFEHEMARQDNVNAMAAIEKAGRTKVIHLSADQRAAWVKALEPVRSEVAGRVGKDVVDELLKEQAAEGH